MSIFYISDLHIGHENVLRFDARPFRSLDEMHSAIIRNWNSAVTPEDKVYILGDFAWKNQIGAAVLSRLAGEKFLIIGNHDSLNEELRGMFTWCKEYAETVDGNDHVIMCHYPIAQWHRSDYGSVHLYGHIHMGRDALPFEEYHRAVLARGQSHECYNVGCMLPYMDYTPRTLAEIRLRSQTGSGV